MNETMFYQAVTMARNGRKADARVILYDVLTANHANELAWLWYAECASSTEERIHDLEFALRLHPNMYRVRAGLMAIRRGKHFEPGHTQPVFISKSTARPVTLLGPEGAEARPAWLEGLDGLSSQVGATFLPDGNVFTVSPEQVSPEEFQAIESRAEALLLNRPLLRQLRRDDPWQSLTGIPVTSSRPPGETKGPPGVNVKTITAMGVMLAFVLLVGMLILIAG